MKTCKHDPDNYTVLFSDGGGVAHRPVCVVCGGCGKQWPVENASEVLTNALREVLDGMGCLGGNWWDLSEECSITEERAKEIISLVVR